MRNLIFIFVLVLSGMFGGCEAAETVAQHVKDGTPTLPDPIREDCQELDWRLKQYRQHTCTREQQLRLFEYLQGWDVERPDALKQLNSVLDQSLGCDARTLDTFLLKTNLKLREGPYQTLKSMQLATNEQKYFWSSCKNPKANFQQWYTIRLSREKRDIQIVVMIDSNDRIVSVIVDGHRHSL
jgi:hypothetical protein